jgi:hypothetical protein
MRSLRVVTFLLSFCCAIASASNRVVLIYDEQEISDHDRAALYDVIIAASSAEQWRTIRVTKACPIETVVDDYFDYWFASKPNEDPSNKLYPDTCAVLAQAIRTRNADKLAADGAVAAGTTLSIPPLPVRGQTKQGEQLRIRLYNPATRSYGWIKSLSKPLPQAADPNDSLATKDHPYRNSRVTAIEVDWTAVTKLISSARADGSPNPHRIPQGSVIVKIDERTAHLTLYEDVCDADRYAAFVSPHADAAREELQRNRERLPEILENNPPMPLVIVDWNFENGHGSKVESVVKQVLHEYGVWEQLCPFVKTFDLNPRGKDYGELKATLQTYEEWFATHADFDKPTTALAFKAAYAWLSDPPAEAVDPDALEHDVDELVLQAVLWRFLVPETSWMNLSFSINYPQGQLINAIYMEGSQSFAVAAAGNQPVPISAGAFPQADAGRYPNIVNITYGKSDGYDLGARSSEAAGGIPVHQLARGCGFKYETISPSEAGSSFATPYVAVTSWLKYIFDRSAEPKKIRDLIVAATRPAAYATPMVRSSGTYEPELLFAAGLPHMTIDGVRKPLPKDTIVRYRYATDTGPKAYEFTVSETRNGGRLFSFDCTENSPTTQYCVWYESEEKKHTVSIAKLIKVTLEFPDGTIQQFTPEDFAKRVTDFCF